MKLRFKQQNFQTDAAMAVVNVFAGQPNMTRGSTADADNFEYIEYSGQAASEDETGTVFGNHELIPELSDEIILENLRKVQRENLITPSERLEGRFNLTVEMETGVGKTYTYIKTIYELNKHYGWSKFIVVVPSVAIREGVYKTFEVTAEHFAGEYGKKISFFIYNSSRLSEIDRFASNDFISVMIINSQAFNARGRDARRIYMRLDEFRSRRPIDIIARTNPIIIIDEPQSVEGKQTRERLKEFKPLFTLRYSATHKKGSIYNMVYRLDAVEAYNRRLVKKIAVKGITQTGGSTGGYVYFEKTVLSQKAPRAVLRFNFKSADGIRGVSCLVKTGYDIYEGSGRLEEYRDGFIVNSIDGRDNSLEFLNGIKMYEGDIIGNVSDEQLRRIQIRETILTHIERETELFSKGIKVLSLFFIDEVAKYRGFDGSGHAVSGLYADIFEEEYTNIVNKLTEDPDQDENYIKYLKKISASAAHAGYFSVDKKGRMIDGRISKKDAVSDDTDAYDLIMKNKELLLDIDPERSPVRFIFSHSALREGWDNPNVFQICTLKASSSDIRKRQEVGRGMRLCVDRNGERQDSSVLGLDVHNINKLTVIASESYESFTRSLQREFAEESSETPYSAAAKLFRDRIIVDRSGKSRRLGKKTADAVFEFLKNKNYIDGDGMFTDKYYHDRKKGALKFDDDLAEYADPIIEILDTVYDSRVTPPENARANNIEPKLDSNKLALPEFRELWSRLRLKTAYRVNFDPGEFIKSSAGRLNNELDISKPRFCVETGEISSGVGAAGDPTLKNIDADPAAVSSVKYDPVGKIAAETGLTRKNVIDIFKKIKKPVFDKFKDDPEEFMLKASGIINSEKAKKAADGIGYYILSECFDEKIFTEHTVKGNLGVSAMKTEKHLYDYIVYDSGDERKFIEKLEKNEKAALYIKLPGSFFVPTPAGRFEPGYAVVFRGGSAVIAKINKAPTDTDNAKAVCARLHFDKTGGGKLRLITAKSYRELSDILFK